ncbi:MAG: 4-phosphopantetheinyl transferase superfamily protein [Mucilaginibacter sp.]|nr:4-phosphopantetheinyl transferase superfamily protein [Mucilaginibacter sp.]
MKSAGNDIVALQLINRERTCHPVFYSKFITDIELDLYSRSDAMPFENFIWLLWSVKESVYKYLKRGDAALVFSPSKIQVQNIDLSDYHFNSFFEYNELESTSSNFYSGSILCDGYLLYFQSLIQSEFIATVVNGQESFNHVYWGVQPIASDNYTDQSKAVRTFALTKLAGLFPDYKLQFKKSPVGYPVLLNESTEMDIPVSFAHHGNYVAYSFQIDGRLNSK